MEEKAYRRDSGKMKILETTKKFVFNVKKGKSELLVIKNNKKEEEEEEEEVVEIEVRKGKIGKTEEYKYLGDYYSKEGNNNRKNSEKDGKGKVYVASSKKNGKWVKCRECRCKC